MDFNSQLDNGVYNRFVENSPKNNEDGEKAQEELISNESVVSSARDDEDLNLRNLEILLSEGQQKRNAAAANLLSDDTCVSNYSFVVEEETVAEVVRFGYPREYVVQSLLANEANYCTASYYLLNQDQNY